MITIHQPEHMPWLGLFDKINKSDTFVILDTVQFSKNYFQNRNRIGISDEDFQWITVPVAKHSLDTKIKDIRIAKVSWKGKYLETIRKIYKGTPYFSKYYPVIESLINKEYEFLSELNIDILWFLLNEFKIGVTLKLASKMDLPETHGGNEVVMGICKAMGATKYLAGSGGRDYMDLDYFKNNGVEVEFNDPHFEDHLSAIDKLFRYGHYTFY